MSDWTPTDEQARELGRVMEREMGSFLAHSPAFPDYFWTNQARAVLVAGGPMIAASALRDAAVAIPGSDTPERIDPYDRGAEWLLDRADQIEKEAGR